MYQIRERIEPLLLSYSLPGLGETTLDRLAELANEMQAGSDLETFLHLDREFHLLSYSRRTTPRSSATRCSGCGTRPSTTARAFTLLVGPDGNRAVHYEHQLLVGALRRSDSEEAERVLYGHIRRTRLELLKHPDIFAKD